MSKPLVRIDVIETHFSEVEESGNVRHDDRKDVANRGSVVAHESLRRRASERIAQMLHAEPFGAPVDIRWEKQE